MPWSNGVYTLPAGTSVAAGETIQSTWANSLTLDIQAAFNTATPIEAGGTGAASAVAARKALAVLAELGGLETVGGTADAITITTTRGAALTTGEIVSFKAGSANTGAATANVDSLGAKAIRRQGDSALSAGDIVSGGKYILVYDSSFNSSAGAWVLINPTVQAAIDAAEAAAEAYVDGKTVIATALSTTSGSTKEWTGLPAGIRRLRMLFDTVRTDGSATPLIQTGDSVTDGYITTGYEGRSTGQAQTNGVATSTGVLIYSNIWTSGVNASGWVEFERLDASSNVWIFKGEIADSGSVASFVQVGGRVELAGPLDRIKLFTTNAFQASSVGDKVNIHYHF